MIAWTFLRVLLHLLAGLATSAFVFPFLDDAGRERRIRRWSAGLLNILHIKVELRAHNDAQLQGRELIVANHVSWLDIFVINSQQPCRFVAKADIRNWPVLGWLCAKSGTIFIARGKQREIRRVYEGLVTSLRKGERIAFFPEGTTAAQGTLLPFHPNLFEAAIEAQVPVQPVALRYVDAEGNLHPAADFVGDMTFVGSLLTIMRSSPMHVQLMPLAEINSDGAHRRELSLAAHRAIGVRLGYVEEAERAA